MQQRQIVNLMEWQKQVQNDNVDANNGKVMMTHEQFETLRKQIAAYANISEQLLRKHKALSVQRNLPVTEQKQKPSGVVGNICSEPLMSSRARWTPTPMQLQILGRIFDERKETPNKRKRDEIMAELSQHGQVSERNVYNWFQNKRARLKSKQHNVTEANTESEIENKEYQSQHNVTRGDKQLCFQNPQYLPYLDSDSYLPYSMSWSHDLSPVSVFHEVPSNTRSDYLAGEMEAPGSSNLYQQAGDCIF